MFEARKCRLAGLLAASLSPSYWDTPAVGKTGMVWTTPPAYETANDSDSSFEIVDGSGQKRRMYDQSYAVMIVEGRYTMGWTSPEKEGERSSALLKDALEKRGFHVLLWKNLTGGQFQTNLNEIVSNIGYQSDARLFFYYFGHGTSVGTPDDTEGPRTFLVPTDAPDQNVDLPGFYRTAVPISRLRGMAGDMTLKHAFFALEACRAGGILSTLAAPPAPNPTGYLFGPTVKKHVRQFLTAGNESEDVPSGTFTSLLLGAFDEGARTDDGYIYTSDVISYVSKNAPRYTKDFPLDPSYFSIPPSGGGDMIIGRAAPLPSNEKQTPRPSTPSYLACRLPENGVESWGIDQPWAGQSAWLGGGNNQSSVCGGLAAGWMQAHPGHSVEVASMGEESNKDVFGHVEYRYFCKGTEKANPTYKLARSASCGVDPGSEPRFVASEAIYLESGGRSDNRSDVCNTHQAEVCVAPSSGNSSIIPGSARFSVAERAGRVYVDGNPANNNPIGTSNIGWFLSPDKNSPGKICATVYARTSACETKVFIKGKLVAQEVKSTQ
jgi:hypothetical protein